MFTQRVPLFSRLECAQSSQCLYTVLCTRIALGFGLEIEQDQKFLSPDLSLFQLPSSTFSLQFLVDILDQHHHHHYHHHTRRQHQDIFPFLSLSSFHEIALQRRSVTLTSTLARPVYLSFGIRDGSGVCSSATTALAWNPQVENCTLVEPVSFCTVYRCMTTRGGCAIVVLERQIH